eukprot:1149697-Pelagomonas_calceolata.AAC.1
MMPLGLHAKVVAEKGLKGVGYTVGYSQRNPPRKIYACRSAACIKERASHRLPPIEGIFISTPATRIQSGDLLLAVALLALDQGSVTLTYRPGGQVLLLLYVGIGSNATVRSVPPTTIHKALATLESLVTVFRGVCSTEEIVDALQSSCVALIINHHHDDRGFIKIKPATQFHLSSSRVSRAYVGSGKKKRKEEK